MLALLLAAGSVADVSAQMRGSAAERQRGFMFAAGAGPVYISYGSDVDAALAVAQSYGLSRVQVYLNLDLGYAVSRNVYLVAGIDGIGDRFYNNSYYVQFNSYLYRLGLRFYPFDKGLVLGVDGGGSILLMDSNVGVSGNSPNGWGAAVTIAYDFSRRLTGFGLEMGAKVDYLSIQSSPITTATFFFDLIWK